MFFIQFSAKDFIPRTCETYDYHCSLLHGPLWNEHSTTYGINFSSTLNNLDHFHVINQLPQDIMHCLLEGVIPYELVLLLNDYIVQRKLFTCDQLNDCIACFSYSNQEAKDKPSAICPQSFSSKGSTISQTCKHC